MKDWWRVLDDQMAANEPKRAARRSIAINYPNSLYSLVSRAAERRGISMTSYQRRAALSFACTDLGIDYLDAMIDEPPVGSYDHPSRGVKSDGIGFGPWGIIGLWDQGAIHD